MIPVSPAPASVAATLAAAIQRSGKRQREIASEVGYLRPNIVTMFKQGHTRVPLDVAPALAQAVGLDPVGFLRACLGEYDPRLLEVLDEAFGDALSENERLLIRQWRSRTAGADPVPSAGLLDRMTQPVSPSPSR